MRVSMEQKYSEFFEIKIKQERLCQLLQNFNIKIHNLEESQRSLQSAMSMSTILDEVKKYVKLLVKEESTQLIYKFYEKLEACNKDISRVEYSCRNFEKNMRGDFESLNEKEKLLEKTVSYLNSHEILRLKNDLEGVTSNISHIRGEIMTEITADRHRLTEVNDKFQVIDEMMETGEEKLDNFQQVIHSFRKKFNELKNQETIARVENLEEKEKEREKQKEKEKDRLPPPTIIKKSRISARRTIDNIAFQRSFDQVKETDAKDAKQVKELKESGRMSREGKENELTALHRKIESLERRVSGAVDSANRIPTAQNIPNERESLISSQQLMQLGKLDSAQSIERGQGKPVKRNSSNFKRGSIRTEDNRDSGEDYGRSYFANNSNNNELRKINERLTSLHFKHTLLEENYDVLLSKISKLGGLEATVQAKIEEAEKLRVDVNTVNEIKLRFKQIQTSMELEEIRYVNHSTYQKEVEAIYKRINAIDALLPLLARKEEVVSAFAFIENKIKEIVIVLSNKFEEEKMGAINKIQHIRCLTCDREANLTDQIKPTTKSGPRNTQNPQNAKFPYDKGEIARRIKTEQREE